MTSQIKLLIYSCIYNESQFLPAMLESLLTQTDQDFSLTVRLRLSKAIETASKVSP